MSKRKRINKLDDNFKIQKILEFTPNKIFKEEISIEDKFV